MQWLLRAGGFAVPVDGVFGRATVRAAGVVVARRGAGGLSCSASRVAEPGLFGGLAWESVAPVLAAVDRVQQAHPSVFVGEFGTASANKALSKAFEDDFKKAETLSLPITLVILVLAFGALLAAFVPLVLAITAVAAAIGLIGPISQIWPVDEAISSVVTADITPIAAFTITRPAGAPNCAQLVVKPRRLGSVHSPARSTDPPHSPPTPIP